MKLKPQTTGKDRIILTHAEARQLRRELDDILAARGKLGNSPGILPELRDALREAGR